MTEQEPTADLQLTGFCVLPSGDVLLDLYAPGRMHHALVDYEGLREVADSVRGRPGPIRGTRPARRPAVKTCNCDRAPLPATGGSPATRTAQRDAVRCWVWLHTRKSPAVWFSAFELCRVLHEQYACEAGESRRGRGRQATVEGVLAELEEAGNVVRSEDGKRWRAALTHGQKPRRVRYSARASSTMYCGLSPVASTAAVSRSSVAVRIRTVNGARSGPRGLPTLRLLLPAFLPVFLPSFLRAVPPAPPPASALSGMTPPMTADSPSFSLAETLALSPVSLPAGMLPGWHGTQPVRTLSSRHHPPGTWPSRFPVLADKFFEHCLVLGEVGWDRPVRERVGLQQVNLRCHDGHLAAGQVGACFHR